MENNKEINNNIEVLGKFNGVGKCGHSYIVKRNIIDDFVKFLEEKGINSSSSINSKSNDPYFKVYINLNGVEYLIGSSYSEDKDLYLEPLVNESNLNELNEELYKNYLKVISSIS